MTEAVPSKYWLFAGDNRYPLGGMEDFLGKHPTIETARAAGAVYDWYEIAVMDEGAKPVIVEASSSKAYDWKPGFYEPVVDARDNAFDPNEYPPGGMRATET